jgi:hypothetical protein
MTYRVGAQGAFFGSFRESMMAVAKAQGLVYSFCVVLVWWCFNTCIILWLQFV